MERRKKDEGKNTDTHSAGGAVLGIPGGFRLARSFAAGFGSNQVFEKTARAPTNWEIIWARAVIGRIATPSFLAG